NTTGDADDITALMDSTIGAFVAALRPTPPANRCAGVKLKATGKKVKAKLGCWGKAVRKGIGVDSQCLAKAEARFASSFASAEASGSCLTTGDAGDIETDVDHLVNQVVAALPFNPLITTTTSSTTTTIVAVCGNAVVEGSEQCDGAADPSCAAGGRSGCFPSGGPKQCKCCTLPGEVAQIDLG